jgi:hypothetical protein
MKDKHDSKDDVLDKALEETKEKIKNGSHISRLF